MSFVLRDYQQQASDSAVTFFNNKAKKTNAIMVLPTGSGKLIIFLFVFFIFLKNFSNDFLNIFCG